MPVTKNTIVAGNTYKTRNGGVVRIFATDAAGDQPIVGQISGDSKTHRWNRDGSYSKYGTPSPNDIIFSYQKKRFANIYTPDVYENPHLYRDLEMAQKQVTGFRGNPTPKAGVLEIVYEWEGEGSSAKLLGVTATVLPA